MTKLIIRKRGNKNLDSLKDMFQKNNIRSAKDFDEYSEKDWVLQLTKDQETQESKTKIKFVKPKSILRTPVYLCYDYNLESLKQEMLHENNINLEELFEYKKLDSNDSEIVGHKGNKIFLISYFFSYFILLKKCDRMDLVFTKYQLMIKYFDQAQKMKIQFVMKEETQNKTLTKL